MSLDSLQYWAAWATLIGVPIGLASLIIGLAAVHAQTREVSKQVRILNQVVNLEGRYNAQGSQTINHYYAQPSPIEPQELGEDFASDPGDG